MTKYKQDVDIVPHIPSLENCRSLFGAPNVTELLQELINLKVRPKVHKTLNDSQPINREGDKSNGKESKAHAG